MDQSPLSGRGHVTETDQSQLEVRTVISFHYSIACSKVQTELPLRADKNAEWFNELKLVKRTQHMCVEC